MITCNRLIKLDTTARGLGVHANKIGRAKHDISYFAQKQVFETGSYITKQGDVLDMRNVADYCNQDSMLLVYLWDHYQFMQNAHQLSIMSFTRMYDAFMNADSSKTANMIIYYSNL